MLHAPHTRRVKRNHEHVAKAINDQAGQSIALGVNHAVGISHGVEPVNRSTKTHGVGDALGDELRVDDFVFFFGEQTNRHRRLHVEHAAADELAVNTQHFDEIAGDDALTRALDHFLKDQGVNVFAFALQPDLRESFVAIFAGHASMLTRRRALARLDGRGATPCEHRQANVLAKGGWRE